MSEGILPRAAFGFTGSGEMLYLHAGISNAGITLF
jgi:hypothetical protein